MLKIKKTLLIIMAAAASPVISSCSMGDEKRDNRDADKLYSESIQLLRVYTDSLSKAPDTIAIQQLMERFEKRLDKINSDVVAETDLHLSEGENDTLAILVQKLINTKNLRIKRVSGVTPADSIANDSTVAAK